MISGKGLPGFLSTLLQHDDHETAHQECGVGLLGVVQTGVVIDFVVLILIVFHEFF